MVMPADQLEKITRYAYSQFPSLERVGVYAHAEDILAKTPEELASLADAGLGIAYLGIETGDDALLKAIGKRTTAARIVEAGRALMDAGITLSGTLILGLAGNEPEKSQQHAIASAEVVNQLSPPPNDHQIWYISTLTLMIPPGTVVHKQVQQGRFQAMTAEEIMGELQVFIEQISDDVHDCVFRSNHASNYLPIKGVLATDKQKILNLISRGISSPDILRPESWRGL
jgi:radical SAM superfamily enzyme